MLEGGLPLSPILASKVLSYLKGEKPVPKPPDPVSEVLTRREKEVLECLIAIQPRWPPTGFLIFS